MSEENIETTEQTDKDKNFAALREKVEALEARNSELEPLAREKLVAEAGFGPDTPAGKSLARLAPSDADVDAVKNLAEELGFEAEGQAAAPTQTKEEQAFQASADKQSELQSVTQSDEPKTIDDDIAEAQAALNAARAAQNWDEARAIGKRLTQMGAQKVFAQTMDMG